MHLILQIGISRDTECISTVSFPKSGHNFIINMHTIFNSKTHTPVHEHDLMIQLNYGIINHLLSSASYRHQNLRLYGIRMCAVLG